MRMGEHLISREIGIDMGHRVPTHGSKCWNLHGHRYSIIASCEEIKDLHREGEQQDMVLDFSFLKTIMMDRIDDYHDHGMTLWSQDPWLRMFISPSVTQYIGHDKNDYVFVNTDRDIAQTKLMVVNFIPTAERLAEFWYHRMADKVTECSEGKARLVTVQVCETPNCAATYMPKVM